MNIQPVNEMMPPRLLFQPGTSFLENNISSSLGEEENAENPTKGSGAEWKPRSTRGSTTEETDSHPLPRDLLSDPIRTERPSRAAHHPQALALVHHAHQPPNNQLTWL